MTKAEGLLPNGSSLTGGYRKSLLLTFYLFGIIDCFCIQSRAFCGPTNFPAPSSLPGRLLYPCGSWLVCHVPGNTNDFREVVDPAVSLGHSRLSSRVHLRILVMTHASPHPRRVFCRVSSSRRDYVFPSNPCNEDSPLLVENCLRHHSVCRNVS